MRFACFFGDLKSVRAAIGRGEDVNAKSFVGKTGLMQALWRKQNSIVKLLLEQPTLDLNCTDNRGATALHMAAEQGNVEGVRMLLADPRLNTHNHKDDMGCTPVMTAMILHSVNTLRELVAHPSVGLDTDNWGESLEDHARWVMHITISGVFNQLQMTFHLFVAGTMESMQGLSMRLV